MFRQAEEQVVLLGNTKEKLSSALRSGTCCNVEGRPCGCNFPLSSIRLCHCGNCLLRQVFHLIHADEHTREMLQIDGTPCWDVSAAKRALLSLAHGTPPFLISRSSPAKLRAPRNVDPSNYSTFSIATSAIQLPSHRAILITLLGKACAC